MPITRSSRTNGHDDSGTDIEVHLSRVGAAARKLRRELSGLRKRNAELEDKIKRLEQAEDVSIQPRRGRSGGPTVSKLQAEIKNMKQTIRDLERDRQKDRRRIEKLRMKEVKADAADLEEDFEFEVGDSAYRMRKLLRDFHDLMVSHAISADEDGEECPICMEKMEVGKCASLICDHAFCENCLAEVSRDSEVVKCPQCRRKCDRNDVEVVRYTASQQWDALLEVARSWAKMDRRREAETSEEEAEEEFIDDEQPEQSSTASEPPNPLASSVEPESAAAAQEESDTEHIARRPAKKRRLIARDDSTSPGPSHRPGSTEVGGLSNEADGQITGSPDIERRPSTPRPDGEPQTPLTPSYRESPTSRKRQTLRELAEQRARKGRSR